MTFSYPVYKKRSISFIWLLPLLLTTLSSQAGIGVDWLVSQSQTDGSYATVDDIATNYQSTAESLSTLYLLGETAQTSMQDAYQFVNDEKYLGTEYLSHKIVENLQQGNTVSVLMDTLLNYQNKDGGFGEHHGYNSTILDTTHALRAITSFGLTSGPIVEQSVNYLLINQQPNGSFSMQNNEASIYITALASQAFQSVQYIYTVSDNIISANDYLLSQIAMDGSIGELFETAEVLTALAPVTADIAVYQLLLDYLQNSQLANGSWADDVFTTALALRALYIQQNIIPQQPDKASLTGQINDASTGTPLNNVNISITTSDGEVTTSVTDEQGRYLISNITAGSAEIQFSANGYYIANANVTLIAGEVFNYDINLLANPSANPIHVFGQLIDSNTLLPIDNASIQIINSGFSTTSNNQGLFDIANIPAGGFTLELVKVGYISQLIAISYPAGGEVNLGVINLVPGTANGTQSNLTGLITDAVTGLPLRGVLISTSGDDNQSTFTGVDGLFILSNVLSGNIVITASLDSYQEAVGNVVLLAGTNLQFNASMVKITNPSLVTIQGLVLSADTQLPLPGVVVTANTGETTTTNNTGGYFLSGLSTGTISLEYSAIGYNIVIYSLDSINGGVINLSDIVLELSTPIEGNLPPVITSTGSTNAAAGQIYEYQPQATDPESGSLVFGLSSNPSGMDIDSSTGIIRWIPTTDQIPQQSFTLVVSDDQGQIAEETVTMTVVESGNPTYVITDVETLNSLTVDGLMPDNYILGSYVQGGRVGTWRARSAQGCGFSYSGGGSDLAAAANALDFWSMGSGFGSDAIWDLSEAMSTVTVLPLIDHAPFPQEGIEYTIWGSDDPDSAFPEGWKLATLVTIYSQGWADNAAVCGGGVNIDDYAGLYTFGQEQYRYIRLKADNSISIFDTPEHTTYSHHTDNSGLPGWQSVESEIDGVVGMLCDVNPIADAGTDILGLTQETIGFDGTNSQGNIVTYGWDLDGDSEIDLTGASPEHVFNAGFNSDVTLLVVDDKGCVGVDTVHVTIGLTLPKPDLIVSAIDSNNVATNLQTLSISGSIELTIANLGTAPAVDPAIVTLFEDSNSNGQFDFGIDNVLGSQTMPSGLAGTSELTMNISINGSSLFRDSPILAMVDSNQQIDESNENNNINTTISQCKVDPALSSFDPVLKWAWTGSTNIPSHDQVISIPIVVPLEDTNNDGLINEFDAPSIIFNTFTGRSWYSNGVLRAISGIDGHELWTVTEPTNRTYPVGTIAAADIDLDGMVEIIVPKSGGGIIVFEHTGEFKWQSLIPQRVLWGGASVADLDNDGSPEIIVGNTVLKNDGTLFWQWSGYLGSSRPAIGGLPIAIDLNLDGSLEVISGASAYTNTGDLLWKNTSVGDGFTAVANFDSDNNPEVVVVSSGRVSLLEHDGTIIWGPVTLPGGGYGGPPTIADMNGDGKPDIGVAGASFYTAFSADGSILWSSPTSDRTSNVTGSSVFDFDGDGKAEVIYNDEFFLRAYKGSDGTILFETPNTSATTFELPVIVDVDMDDHADIVVCSNSSYFGGETGIRVYEDANNSWMPTRSIWNQHSYHINNINDDGTVPQFEQPSWLSHNTYRLNTFADRDITLLVDITASQITIHDNGANQPASISVRIGNAGAGDLTTTIGVAFYEGNPADSGVLLGIVSMDNLAQGSYQDIELMDVASLSGTADIYVFADYDNRVQECNEANNSAFLPVLPQTSTGQINVATDQLVYGPDNSVQLQSSIVNTSGVPGEFKAELLVEDSQGALVQSYNIHSIGPLAGGENLPLSELWNTAQYQAGTYVLRGYLYNLNNEVIHQDSSTFEIRHSIDGEPLAALRILTDKSIYNTNDVAQIFNFAQNLAFNQTIDDASLLVTVLNATGVVVFSETIDLGSMTSGAFRELTSYFAFTQAQVGNYTAKGELYNGDGELLATDQTQFEVVANLQQLLTGNVVALLPTLDRGQIQTCTDTLNLSGTTDLTAQSIRQLVVNLDSGELVTTIDSFADIIVNQPSQLLREVNTNTLTASTYACILQAKINEEWINLANDTFIVTVPPINIEGELRVGDRGRVLILLDDASQHCDGFTRIASKTTFLSPLTVDTTVTTTLYDAVGSFVDQETGQKDDRLVNQQAGSNGVNLILDYIDSTKIISSMNTQSLLGSAYQLLVSTFDGIETTTYDSGLIPTDCSQTLAVSDIYGDSQLSEVIPYSDVNDPLGPNHTPDLTLQRTVLEEVLTQAGWSYTITTTSDDFIRELRTGTYVTYMLLSEKEKLAQSEQKELREAVYRGEGLIEAGSHDQRQGQIDEALGIDFRGKHPHMQGFGLIQNPVTPIDNTDFGLTDRTLRVNLSGATAIANFVKDGNSTTDIAITNFEYGQGRSIYVGFDLAAELALASDDSLYETLLLDALDYVHTDSLSTLEYGILPVQITLDNLGVATPGQVVMILPADVELIDANNAAIDGQTLIWPFDLQEQQQLTINLWVKLPAQSVEFTALIQTGLSPDWLDHVTLILEITPQVLITIDEVYDLIFDISDRDYRQVQKYMQWAQLSSLDADWAKTLSDLLRVTDALITIATPQSEDLRIEVAKLIRSISINIETQEQ